MNDLLDLDRYPLHALDEDAGRSLVEACRDSLERDGMFTLRGLLRPAALEQMLPQILKRLEGESFTHARRHNIYFDDELHGLAADHPALARVETINHTLCGDQIGEGLMRVYRSRELIDFLAQVMRKQSLYVMDDPLACANVLAYRAGEGLNWHFDRSEFTTTLLLQAPEQGGEFQYRQGLRSDDDPNYDGVARLLRGEDPAVQTLQLGAGDLNVFRGKNTAHRVSAPRGARARVVAVFLTTRLRDGYSRTRKISAFTVAALRRPKSCRVSETMKAPA